jgi:predicted phage tail protein
MLDAGMAPLLPIPVQVQRHPFESRTQPVEMPAGTNLLAMVRAAGLPEKFHQFVRVFVNDGEVPRAAWGRVRPRVGATVYIRVVPQGGGGEGQRKNILATVLMLVVVVAAAYFAPTLATSLTGLSAGAPGFAMAKSLVSAGLTMIGSLAISALIPPPTPDQGIPSQLQLLSGVRNQFRPYADVARIFGKRRVYPMQAARPYTEAQGKDRYLRILLAVGFGPLKISDIKIGETPIDVYKGVEIEVLEGWAAGHSAFGTLPGGKVPDAAPKLFTSAVTEAQFNVRLPAGTPGTWETRTTEPNADEFSVDVMFPEGLANYDDKGRRLSVTVNIDVEYRLTGSGGAWTGAVWAGNDEADGTQTNGKLICKDKSQSPTLRGGRVVLPARGQYDVRLRRTTGGDVSTDQSSDRSDWVALRTVRYEAPVSFPGMSLIAIRMKATDQLNGVPDTINCVAESYLPVYNGSTWAWELSRNGAWAFADTLRRRGTEVMVPTGRIDLPAISAWAAANAVTAPNAAEPYWTFDAVVERGAMFTVLRQIAAHSRANLLVRDGKYSVVRDVAQTVPVQHITPRNSFGYSGSKTFIDLPHGLKVQFVNAERGYQEDVAYVYADGYTQATATKFEALDLPACTSKTQAWRDGRYNLAVGKLRPEEHSCTMDVENLRCTVGDLVRLSHDVLQIGVASGRIKGLVTNGGNTTGLVLEGEVPNFTGKSYVFRVRDKYGASSLYSVAPAASDADRVTLSLATPVPTSVGPKVGDLFIYGESALESAPMLVKKIEPGPDFTARLVFTDAQDVYSADTGAIPAFNTYVTSDTPVGQLAPPLATYYVASDYTVAVINTDGTVTERIAITIPPQPSSLVPVSRYEVQFREAGGTTWESAGRIKGENTTVFIPGVARGQGYDLRVRSIAENGLPSDWVYTLAHTVVGITNAPAVPTGLQATAGVGVINLLWNTNPEADILHYDIYISANATAPNAGTPASLTTAATYFNDTGLTQPQTRYYWVRAVNRSQNKSAWTTGVSATSLSVSATEAAPAVPTGLALSSTNVTEARATVSATWAAASGAVHYEVSVTPLAGNEVVYPISGLRYDFVGNPGLQYAIKVRSVNAVGSKSAYTTPQNITGASDTTPPAQVTGLVATGLFETIWLSWGASAAPDLARYEIYEHTAATPAPTAGTAATFTSNATTFVRTALPNGAARWYWVRAVDTSGNKGTWSALATATTPTGATVTTQQLTGLIDATAFAANLEPVRIASGTLPTTKTTNVLTFEGKLYRWNGTAYVANISATDLTGQVKNTQIDGKGLDILDQLGAKVFGADGTIGQSATVYVNGNNVLLSTVAANALVPAINYVGEYTSAPTQVQLGASWKQNAVYKNSTDGKSYVLTGDPLAWVAYIVDGKQFTLGIESSNGTAFKVGQARTTLLSARLFKNGAEVTEETPAGWFRWRRVSIFPQQPPNDDASWNASYATGFKAVSINVDQVLSRATFFCDVISPT